MNEKEKRDVYEGQLLAALVGNPERYKEMRDMYMSGSTNEDLTAKNVNKAQRMADALMVAQGHEPQFKQNDAKPEPVHYVSVEDVQRIAGDIGIELHNPAVIANRYSKGEYPKDDTADWTLIVEQMIIEEMNRRD